MSSTPKTPDTELAEILESYHRHNCHSMQAWFKGQTRPFPCDCDIVETAAALTAWRDRAVVAELNTLSAIMGGKYEHRAIIKARISKLTDGGQQ